MQLIDRRKFAVLMVFHLLWGSVLWFSISKLGLGLSTDSVPLLFAGMNLAQGRGLLSFDGASMVAAWPPLYPVLLALVHLLTGLSTFAAAHVLQVLAFAGLSVCLSILFLRLFPGDFLFALAGSLLSDIGIVVVASFGIVGSDYIHLFLVMLCVLLTAFYLDQPSGRLYVAIFIAAMLAMLQRYLGIAAIAMAATSILVWSNAPRRERLLRALVMFLAALPAVLWLVLTCPIVSRRPPVSFAENFEWFSQAVLQWFLSADAIQAHPVFYVTLLWIVIALIVLALWIWRAELPPLAAPVLLFGLLYAAALFGSAAIAYYNRLEGRFLLPLYIPFIAALLLALHRLQTALRRPAARLGAIAFLALLSVLLLHITVPAVQASHAGLDPSGDNSFNTLAWRRNDALAYWRTHRPAGNYILLSNQPDGVAFYTQHTSDASPRSHSGPYGQTEYPVESYASTLFASGQDVYILWIEPEDQSYYYKPRDLEPIANVEQLYSGDGGAVFHLTPLAAP